MVPKVQNLQRLRQTDKGKTAILEDFVEPIWGKLRYEKIFWKFYYNLSLFFKKLFVFLWRITQALSILCGFLLCK